jgi:ADP-ribose pyrophosphatase YjhB (NUDIX family)
LTPADALPAAARRGGQAAEATGEPPSLAGRALRALLPLVKLRTQLRGISLGVRACVRNEHGQILLIRHSYLPGWHFPGGGVEFGETAAQAVERELAEEGGVSVIAAPQLVGLFRNPEWTAGDHVAFFQIEHWAPCPTRWGVEIEGAGFFAEHALPADAHPSVRRRLAEAAGAPQSAHW